MPWPTVIGAAPRRRRATRARRRCRRCRRSRRARRPRGARPRRRPCGAAASTSARARNVASGAVAHPTGGGPRRAAPSMWAERAHDRWSCRRPGRGPVGRGRCRGRSTDSASSDPAAAREAPGDAGPRPPSRSAPASTSAAERHVAGDARRSSGTRPVSSSPRPPSRSIRSTAQAAPKPLSMPTTVTPAAHDASIAEQRGDALQDGAVADARRARRPPARR